MKFAVFLLVLLVLAGGLWFLFQAHGGGFLRVSFGAEEAAPATAARPAAPARVVMPIASGVAGAMPWMTDERWERALQNGEYGIELIELAYHEHFEVAGDPFKFRSRKEEAGRLLASAVADLSALREQWQDNPTAVLDIQPLLRKYEEGLEKAPRR